MRTRIIVYSHPVCHALLLATRHSLLRSQYSYRENTPLFASLCAAILHVMHYCERRHAIHFWDHNNLTVSLKFKFEVTKFLSWAHRSKLRAKMFAWSQHYSNLRAKNYKLWTDIQICEQDIPRTAKSMTPNSPTLQPSPPLRCPLTSFFQNWDTHGVKFEKSD